LIEMTKLGRRPGIESCRWIGISSLIEPR